MKPAPFFIEYLHENQAEIAEVKPCCQEDNVYYYDIYIRNQYQFTITPSVDDEKGMYWRLSLKNADNRIEKGVVDAIGREIEKHLI